MSPLLPLLLLATACQRHRPGLDEDDDGWPASEDCDDQDPSVYPGSHKTEVPFDGVDNDCDGNDFCLDLDCDAWPDLVATRHADEDGAPVTTSLVLWGSEGGYGAEGVEELASSDARAAAIADLDGDGYLDLVFANGEGNADSVIWWGGRLGLSAAEVTWLPAGHATGLALADLDGDGLTDVALSVEKDGEGGAVDDYDARSLVYWNDGDRFAGGEVSPIPTFAATGVGAGDFDGDGLLDLAFSQGTTLTTVSTVFLNDGARFADAEALELPSDQAEGVVVADFDEDGYDDLFIANWCGGMDCDSTWWRGGEGGLDPEAGEPLPTTGASGGAAADFDGDGDLDLAVANALSEGFDPVVEAAVFWQSAGDLTSGHRSLYPCTGCVAASAGDADGDGLTDLLLASEEGEDGGPGESLVYPGTESGGLDAENAEVLVRGAVTGLVLTPDVAR